MGTGCVEMLFGCNRICSPPCPLQCYIPLQLSNHTEISPEESPFHYFISRGAEILAAQCNPSGHMCLGHQPLAGRGGCRSLCWGRYLGCFPIASPVCPSPWPWLPSKEPGLSARVFRGFFCSQRKQSSVASSFVHQNRH